MKIFAPPPPPPPWNYDNPIACGRRVLDRKTMVKSMVPLILLAGFIALVLMIGESVQSTRAANDIIGASAPTEQQPERSGVLSAWMPAF
jgi:hypothetical protein